MCRSPLSHLGWLAQVGYPCLSLHGGKDQSDRESTINDFKQDVCNLLVATSIAARGLDVKELVLVVNYDTPNHHEDYVHRVGRTGQDRHLLLCLSQYHDLIALGSYESGHLLIAADNDVVSKLVCHMLGHSRSGFSVGLQPCGAFHVVRLSTFCWVLISDSSCIRVWCNH